MIRGTTASHAIGGLEAQSAQIECVHEGINHPHRVVIVDEVFQPIREQKPLGTINAIHESLHAEHPLTGAQIMPVEAGFSHSLGQKRTLRATSGGNARTHYIAPQGSCFGRERGRGSYFSSESSLTSPITFLVIQARSDSCRLVETHLA